MFMILTQLNQWEQWWCSGETTRIPHQCDPCSISRPGACFLKVPKLFGRISGDIILLYLQNEGVSRHETLQLFLFLIPLQHIKRTAMQGKQVVVLRMAFRARKVLGTFEKRAPGVVMWVKFDGSLFFSKRFLTRKLRFPLSSRTCIWLNLISTRPHKLWALETYRV